MSISLEYLDILTSLTTLCICNASLPMCNLDIK